jgi:hypothetical protein
LRSDRLVLLDKLLGNRMVTSLGNDDQMVIIGVCHEIGGVSTSSLEIVVVDPKGMKAAPDDVVINTENIIRVEMGDSSKKDRDETERELQWKLEEVLVERIKKKLARFQKTRSRIIKKSDTTKASVLVNSPFTLEELVHMIDVSVNNKYGADLEGITRTITDSMRGRLNLLGRSSNRTVRIY